jgi:hypothetical protein
VAADRVDAITALVPDAWLEPAPGLETPEAHRSAYRDHLLARAANPHAWLPGGRR